MTTAAPITITYLVIATYLLFERKYWQLLPLAFVFALTSDLFVLLALAVVIWTAVIGWTERRFEWRPLAWVAFGCLLGLTINPYFPRNIHFLYEYARIKTTAGTFNAKAEREWFPTNTWDFGINSVVALVAMFAGYVTFNPGDRENSQRPLFFLLLATALMPLAMLWKEFGEYFPPFAVLFAAFTLQRFWLGRSGLNRLPSDVLEELSPFLESREPSVMIAETSVPKSWRRLAVSSAAILLLAFLVINARWTARHINDSDPPDHFASGALWMRANIPPGQRIFNTDWDDFPRLFYYDPTHAYVSGLDPIYLMEKSTELSSLYDHITNRDQKDPGPLIRDRFGAQWVFSNNTKDHDAFFDNALRSGWFDRVYEDSDCSILHLRDQKGQSTSEANEQ
jgi:hypothetical protein